jgi:hypothetical protein
MKINGKTVAMTAAFTEAFLPKKSAVTAFAG